MMVDGEGGTQVRLSTKAIASGAPFGRNLAIAVAALAPLVLLAGSAVLSALDGFRAADEGRLRNTVRALASAVDAELRVSIAALTVLAGSSSFNEEFDAHKVTARTRPVGEALGGWIVVLGPPPDYRVQALSNQADPSNLPQRLPPATEAALRAPLASVFQLRQPGVSDLFKGNVIVRQIITIMVPVERDGEVRHALALSLEPSRLQALLTEQELPEDTFAGIADGQFRVLADSRDPQGGQVGIQGGEWVRAAIGERQRGMISGTGIDGRLNVYAFERLNVAPDWIVVVGEPVERQNAMAWKALQWLVAGGAALGVGLAIAVWANRREAIRDAHREARALRDGRAQVERLHAGLGAIIFRREVWRDGTSRLLYRGGDLFAVTGWPEAALAEKDDLGDLVVPGDPQLPDHIVALWDDRQVQYEWRLQQPDGGVRWMRTQLRVLGHLPAETLDVVGYTLDITAEREAKARALGSTRLASLGEMAAGMAHELRQPLQSISLAAEIGALALAAHRDGEAAERLETIVEQAQRAGDLIEQLRRFARGAERDVEPVDVSLSSVVDAALVLTGAALREADVEVQLDIRDPPPVVRGHGVLLEQVLTNLLLNARDALAQQPAGTPRRILVTAGYGDDGHAWLRLADNGGGIAPEVLERIFEPFVTTKDADKGTGLGLSICHGLITSMGGSITAANETDGAVFSLILKAGAAAGRG